MIPKRAIELAIEGGWKMKIGTDGRPYRWMESSGSAGAWYLTDAEIALDPTFWQALGKALGWTEAHALYADVKGQQINGRAIDFSDIWMQYAKRFYDLILTGGDMEKFWEEILK